MSLSKIGDRDELLIRYLRVPGEFAMTQEEWEKELRDALQFGCDWLEHLQEHNPMPAAAIEQLCATHHTLQMAVLQARRSVNDKKGST